MVKPIRMAVISVLLIAGGIAIVTGILAIFRLPVSSNQELALTQVASNRTATSYPTSNLSEQLGDDEHNLTWNELFQAAQQPISGKEKLVLLHEVSFRPSLNSKLSNDHPFDLELRFTFIVYNNEDVEHHAEDTLMAKTYIIVIDDSSNTTPRVVSETESLPLISKEEITEIKDKMQKIVISPNEVLLLTQEEGSRFLGVPIDRFTMRGVLTTNTKIIEKLQTDVPVWNVSYINPSSNQLLVVTVDATTGKIIQRISG